MIIKIFEEYNDGKYYKIINETEYSERSFHVVDLSDEAMFLIWEITKDSKLVEIIHDYVGFDSEGIVTYCDIKSDDSSIRITELPDEWFLVAIYNKGIRNWDREGEFYLVDQLDGLKYLLTNNIYLNNIIQNESIINEGNPSWMTLPRKFGGNYIDFICRKYNIKNYTINNDRSINVDGDVLLYGLSLTKIPLKFKVVNGSFFCNLNGLTTLENCPEEVLGDFYCNDNQLVTLKGGPLKIGGNYDCSHNYLISLNYLPKIKNESSYIHAMDNKYPPLIQKNIRFLSKIIKYQDDYSIWNSDDTLNEFRFNDMMIEIIEL